MQILILSFYFPPDLSAGSFRANALVNALREEAGDALQLDVITTAPNRYQSHQAHAPLLEESNGVRVQRIVLPPHQSGMADQAKAFTRFARQSLSATSGKSWDLVFATSSRLMTAALGAHVARRADARLYLDIRDLFTDTMSDLLSGSATRFLLPVFHWLERKTLRYADRVNVVSAGFLPHVQRLAPKQSFRSFTNGIDEEFLGRDFAKPAADVQGLPLILYAGNIGEGQGLHRVLPEAARLLDGRVRFRVVGDGGRRTQLENALADAAVDNVELMPPVPRDKLFEQYREADILFLHLNDHAAFRKVLPSKLFEYAATGKPMLAGVAGYAAEFLREQVAGVEVFSPCDPVAMVSAVDRLMVQEKVVDRSDFCLRFVRKYIMREMARDILAVVG